MKRRIASPLTKLDSSSINSLRPAQITNPITIHHEIQSIEDQSHYVILEEEEADQRE